MKRGTIEYHLKSAMDSLTPDVLSRIDLKTPQDQAPIWQESREEEILFSSARQAETERRISFGRRFRAWGVAAAACICLVIAGNGGYSLYLNQKIDSVIGIDVNPSVELSINRKNKVLEAIPLNDDARIILEEMNLEGVDLNIAVNAVIGSLVTHGYLDELDNAILVTVTNDSISKADVLRQEVVEDIEESLKENQVQAVVYDQQVVEKDEIKSLAEEYGISYGKAYFLQELIRQNDGLTMEDMEELAGLTMEQIAEKITERAYALGERTQKQETSAAETVETTLETETPEETSSEVETTEETVIETSTVEETTTAAPATVSETMVEEEAENRLKIDFADYEDGILTIYFTSNVRWKEESVSIRGEGGESYAAMIEETYSDSCEISVKGLEGGKTYRFSIGGVRQKEDGKPMSVSGTFETPMISEEVTERETQTTEEETGQDASDDGTTEAGSDAEATSEVDTSAAENLEKETSSNTPSTSQVSTKETSTKETFTDEASADETSTEGTSGKESLAEWTVPEERETGKISDGESADRDTEPKASEIQDTEVRDTEAGDDVHGLKNGHDGSESKNEDG